MTSKPATPPDPGADPSAPAAAARAEATGPTRDEPQSGLFRAVWRWHFYAGLLTIPVIMLLGISGIVYLFKPQIDALAYGSLRHVAAGEQRLTYAAQSAAVAKAYPGSTITGLAPPVDQHRATEFDLLTPAGQDLRVYVDPYSARINGDRSPSASFTTLALDLHGTLLTSRFLGEEGKPGDRVIELAASWAVVLVISGMYLWWPRGRRGFRQALRPRLRATSSRTRWRDLHAVTGVLFGFVTLFFLITGLLWTGVWGDKVNKLATSAGALYPAGLYDGADSATVADTVKNGKAAWAAGALPLANSVTPSGAGGASSGVPPRDHADPSAHEDSPDHAPTTASATQTAAASDDASKSKSNGGSTGAIPETGGRPGHSGHSGHMDVDGASSTSQPKTGASGGGDTAAVGSLSAADVRAITTGRDDIEIDSGDDGHTGHTHATTLVWDPREGAPIDAIVGRAQAMGFPAGFTLAYPGDPVGSYTVSKFPDADVDPDATAGSERVAYVDQYTALPLRDHKFDDFGIVGKASDFGIALHEGRQWGIWSQLFSLFGTLALLLTCASAVVMWRKRKPKGIGAPRRAPNRKLGIGVVVLTLGLGVLFPLLGISILVLLAFDFLIVPRVPRLARALGAG